MTSTESGDFPKSGGRSRESFNLSYLLAIESATKNLSLALFEERTLVEEIEGGGDPRTHSEKLLPLIDSLLSRQGLTLDDLQTIVVSQGPGSYTSLRVGLATVAGLNLTGKMALYGISTLKVCALGVEEEKILVAPVLRAGRGMVYAALYRKEKKNSPLNSGLKEAVYEPGKLTSLFDAVKEGIHLIGTGIDLMTRPKLTLSARMVPPRASHAAWLHFLGDSQRIDPSHPKINYLLEPDFGPSPTPLTVG